MMKNRLVDSNVSIVRKHAVQRARMLKTNLSFCDRLDSSRSKWNARYPEFSISGEGKPPAGADFPIFDMAFPVGLWNKWSDPDRPPERTSEDRAAFFRVNAAFWDWKRLVDEVTALAFPQEHYPKRVPVSSHIAVPFISLCLMYNQTFVPENSVLLDNFGPEPLWYDPYDLGTHHVYKSNQVQLRGYQNALVEELANDPDMLRRIELRVIDEERVAIESSEIPPASVEPVYWFVPLSPFMTSTNWRKMEPLVLSKVSEIWGDDPTRDQIRDLSSVGGLSNTEIAKILGTTPQTVRKHLGGAKAG